MGACWSSNERLKMKYIPGYRDKVDNSCCSDTTSYDMKAAKKWNKWGIELSVIKDFIEECGGEEVLKGLTTRQVTDKYLKPIMFKRVPNKGQSYAAWKRRHKQHRGVRDAEVYVVHAWDSIFLDVVESMENYLDENYNHKDVPIWFDMLCLNQCKNIKLRKYSYEWFKTTFSSGIEEISKVMIVTTPWDKPLIFERTWCLWEMYTALSSIRDIKFGFTMPKSQYKLFKESISEDSPMTIPYSYFRMVDQIVLKKSKSYLPKHKYTMLLVANEIKGQENRVNKRVRECIRDWIIKEGVNIISDSMRDHEKTDAEVALANIYRHLGQPDGAIPLLESAFEQRKRKYGNSHEKTLEAAYMLGNIFQYSQNFNNSHERIKKREEEHRIASEKAKKEHSYLLYHEKKRGILDEPIYFALKKYEFCLKQREKMHGILHPTTMHMIVSVALVLNNLSLLDRDDIDNKNFDEIPGSISVIEFLQDYRNKYLYHPDAGPEHEYTQCITSNLANTYLILARHKTQKYASVKLSDQQDLRELYLEKAIQLIDTVKAPRQVILGEENPDVLYLFKDYADSKAKLGHYTEARIYYEKVFILTREKFEKAGHPSHPAIYEAMHSHAVSMLNDPIFKNSSDPERILEECLKYRKLTLGYDHPDTKLTRDVLLKYWKDNFYHEKHAKYLDDSLKEDRIHYDKKTKHVELSKYLPDSISFIRKSVYGDDAIEAQRRKPKHHKSRKGHKHGPTELNAQNLPKQNE